MCFCQVYIVDIGKALGAQQLMKNLRGDASRGVFLEPDRGDFRRRLRRERLAPGAKAQARSANECGISQKPPAALDRNGTPP
jgi:hypothetical protein